MKDEWVQLPEGIRESDDLEGKYRIGAVIGSGASSTVFCAQHVLHGGKVAIKFLRSLGSADPSECGDAVARFVREAQAAMSIGSEHVVRVFDVAMLDNGIPYIVMEYLEGDDLARTLTHEGPFHPEDAVDYLLEACEAIAEAHRLGIIHRDLKPANLFLARRPGSLPSVKVLDFGISKNAGSFARAGGPSRGRKSTEITDANAILGSPFYMSPEQMESTRDVDSRTDIWSLGVTLFELLTSNRPFGGHSIVQVYSKIMARGPQHWRSELHDCPPGLVAVVAKCLARDRNRRYASVGDLARALKPFGSARAEVSLLRIRQTLAGSGLVQTSTLEPHTLLRSPESARAPATLAPPSRARARGARAVFSIGLAACIALTLVVLTGARTRQAQTMRSSAAPSHPTEPREVTTAPVIAHAADEQPRRELVTDGAGPAVLVSPPITLPPLNLHRVSRPRRNPSKPAAAGTSRHETGFREAP
jgi:serine/threonine protein kinase